jgi:hypothetical protein
MSISRKKNNKEKRAFVLQKNEGKKKLWIPLDSWENFKKIAESEGVSTSEVIERWGRGLKPPSASSHP